MEAPTHLKYKLPNVFHKEADRLSVLTKNIAANFAGGAWTGLMGLVFVPLYVHFLGIEAYGLIGLFVTLQALLQFLDMGLSSNLNREIARLAVQTDSAQSMRDLVRTFEIPYWLLGLLLGAAMIGLAPIITYHWVNPEELSPASVRTAIMLMGLVVAVKWPMTLYSCGLLGLERQVLLNGIAIIMATVRGVGAVLIIWLVAPTIEAFFLWQIVVSALHVSTAAFFLWRSLPRAAAAPRFRRELLLTSWRFGAGMTGILVLRAALTQMDKVFVSRVLSLELFGYYALAGVIAMNLYQFVTPVFSATFPRLSKLVASRAMDEVARVYHKSTQLVTVLLGSASVMIALFSKELLLLWTRNAVTTEHTYVVVSIMVLGVAVYGFVQIPYALQLAFGWTRLALLGHLVSVIFFLPLLFILTRLYGAVGAASVSVIVNSGYLVSSLHVMHKRLLHNEKKRWYVDDVGRPLFVAATVATVGRLLMNPEWNPIMLAGFLVLVGGATLLASAFTANQLDARLRLNSLLAFLRTRSC